MKIIADSSSTRTEWSLVDCDTVVEHAYTQGLNPYFLSRREISHSIRLELPETFFKHRWEHIFFYGAGCANEDKNKIMEMSLVAQFKTPVTIESDLLGAARGLFVNTPGIACILGTGSNSCVYDGSRIIRNVRPAGFILGDEGSGADLGKQFVADCLKNLAPAKLHHEFFEKFSLTSDAVMDAVYTATSPNRTLSRYATFLADHLDNEYVVNLVTRSFERFFDRNIGAYAEFRHLPLGFVGSTAIMFADLLRKVAYTRGLEISKIARASMPGLIKFHTD